MKKSKLILGLLSAAVVSLGLVISAAAATVGDIDGNESLSPRDALLVLKSAAGMETGDYTVSVENADITADGVVNAEDALAILARGTGNTYWHPATPYNEPFSGNVFIMGDSIAADHNAANSSYERPLYGWGVVFDEYFVNTLELNNYAVSSESTKSYTYNNNYYRTLDEVQENDYVFVAYGHNDHTPGEMHNIDRTTPIEGDEYTEGSFKWHLKTYYIDPLLEKGAVPILMTAVCRATFDEDGVFTEDPVHLQYGQAVVELAEAYQAAGKNVYVIDTQTYTYNLYTELTKEEGGKEEVMSYHGLMGDSSSQWNFDSTHYCEKGARMIAEYVIETLDSYHLDLVRYLRADWETVGDN